MINDSVIIGELCGKREANQFGLLSSFKEEGIPYYANADGSYSSAAIYKGVLSGEKDTSDRMNDLGLGNTNGSNKYRPSEVEYNSVGSQGVTLSYKTILKYIVVAAVVIGVILLARHYYKKMK